MTKIDYKAAGVDIAAGAEAVSRLKSEFKSTFSSAVLTDIGGFGASYDLKSLLNTYKHPVMVQSIDGVGTKTMLAKMTGRYDTLGQDLLSATCNDIVVMGAKPLTFLDYIAADDLDPDIVETILRGMITACKANNVSLTGGETAEMPKVYHESEHDLVGVITGIVDKDQMITGQAIQPGDVVLGFSSSGLHTNGYSLARKLFFEEAFYAVDEVIPELNGTLADILLAPHINYTNPIHAILDKGIAVHGMAHITGGGFIENIPRVLPAGCAVRIQQNSWTVPPVFQMMQRLGHLDDVDMFETFNMGIGLVMMIPAAAQSAVEAVMQSYADIEVFAIGEVISSQTPTVEFSA